VLENLVENAVEFCGTKDPYIRIVGRIAEDQTTLEVVDNGVGINLEYEERIFDMYFRANERSKGNGLGLYIVKKAIDRLEGTIELQTVEYKGTIVTVTLPNLYDKVSVS